MATEEQPAAPRGAALVTGASRGIGAAIARTLAADGRPVGVNYVERSDAADAVVNEIVAAGGRAVALQADVSDPSAADPLFARAEEELGAPVLVLVNNAGVRADNLSPAMEDEEWQRVLDTNLSAAFRTTRRALRAMMKARYGRVINVASVVGQRASPGQANYAAAKAGLVAFTKTVAAEVAQARRYRQRGGSRLCRDGHDRGSWIRRLLELVPARRLGTPEEVAACVRFLASEDARYVTGAVLTVDGGLTA